MSILGLAMRTSLLASVFVGAGLWPADSRAESGKLILTDITTVAASTGRRLDTVAVTVDFAAVIQLGADIGTIVLGNSAIADATVTNGQMVVLTGKSVGITNMIVLGVDNTVLAEITLQVGGRKPGTVTVMRALKRQSYACEAGLCKESGLAEAEAPPLTASAP
jgi:Flp pilus assembly secretin CpaC